MSWLDRARAWVGALLAPAQDPRQTADGPAAQLARVRVALASLEAARHRTEQHRSELERRVAALEEQARSAVLAGREEAARARLREVVLGATQVRALQAQALTIAGQAGRLALVEQGLSARVDSLAVRREVLTARRDAAQAEISIGSALQELSMELGDLDLVVERAEDGATAARVRLSAIEEPGRPLSTDDPALELEVESRLAAIESEYRRD